MGLALYRWPRPPAERTGHGDETATLRSLGTISSSKMADYKRSSLLFCVAFASRIVLIYSPVKDWLINRIELSTPLTAWNRGMFSKYFSAYFCLY